MTSAYIDTEGFARLVSDEAVYAIAVRPEGGKVLVRIEPGRTAYTTLVLSQERVLTLVKALQDALKEAKEQTP